MKIAIIGRGGREHALAWKLAQDAGAENVFCLPGNGGTANNRPIAEHDFAGIRSFCEAEGIDLVVVGPEAPLARGLVDLLAGAKIRVFGPTRAAARLESSKTWAKQFMQRHGIATAAGAFFESVRAAAEYVRTQRGGLVVKYSGLAAGKGVFVCPDPAAAPAALQEIGRRHGPNAPIVVEELLEGPEVSIMGVVSGTSIQLFPASRDHKRLLDGDRGPNTGGMGAYAPVPDVDAAQLDEIRRTIIEPTLQGLAAEGIAYRGFLYFGLMLTAAGPKLLEYNARLGDPEAEVLLPALAGPLLPTLLASFDGTLERHPFAIKPGAVVDVVLAAGGYPNDVRAGVPIAGADATDALVFHAGTEIRNGALTVAGGRVLNVVAHGADLAAARRKAYAACAKIRFDGMQYRTDIGGRAPA
ncbi:MAG TPA: phosphoribosylamine--glycine ligase [Kiritimatiellia bacterium]|nr:phosphoribosylamine--glycine ligase [Kiritimatiellia bacterium]